MDNNHKNKNKNKNKLQPKLIIHFDVNETILVEDIAGGDTKNDCLNKILAKSAFVRIPSQTHNGDDNTEGKEPTHWWDGTVIDRSYLSCVENFDDTADHDDSEPVRCGHSNVRANAGRVEQGEECGLCFCNGNSSSDIISPSVPPLLSDWQWPSGCAPYYRYYRGKGAKTFTQNDGRIYKPIYDKMQEYLSFQRAYPSLSSAKSHKPEDEKINIMDHRLSKDGGKSHFLLPAFFECLYQLDKKVHHDNYSIVIRTFGSDLTHVARAIKAFAEGKHPDYPDYYNTKLTKMEMYKGQWHVETSNDNSDNIDNDSDREEHINVAGTKKVTYRLNEWSSDLTGGIIEKTVAWNDDEVLDILESNCITGIKDDYVFWSSNDCAPHAGKPIWIRDCSINKAEASRLLDRLRDEKKAAKVACANVGDYSLHASCTCKRHAHHIIFDDNIKNDPYDSIAAVRYHNSKRPFSASRSDVNDFRSLSGCDIIGLHGVHLVRVPTFRPILDKSWFFQQICSCVEKRSQLDGKQSIT